MDKTSWKACFSFTKKERFAVYILAAIIICFFILPYFIKSSFHPPQIDEDLQKQLVSLQIEEQEPVTEAENVLNDAINTARNANTTTGLRPFNFDPNTLEAEGFKKMGLRDKTIQTLLNYRSKGGYFNQPEDIRKIYGLRTNEADALIPFIKIQSAADKTSQTITAESSDKQNGAAAPLKKIDVNTATEEEFKTLPGIGEVLSNRIVKFRTSVNGFSSVQDIKRTYGLSDSVYQLILPHLFITDYTAGGEE